MAAALQNCAMPVQPKALLPTSRHHPKPRGPFAVSFSSSSALPSVSLAARLPRSRREVKAAASAASSYAEALVDVAKSSETLEATSSDVETIEKVFADPDVLDFFSNPIIEVEKKQEVLEEIIKSSGIQPHSGNFLRVLLDAGRIDQLKDVAKEFEKVYNEITDTQLAVVNSVVKLEPQHLSQIAKQVQQLTGAKNVRLKNNIDTSLVAGFTVLYGEGLSKKIDMSVKKQLEELAGEVDVSSVQLAV